MLHYWLSYILGYFLIVETLKFVFWSPASVQMFQTSQLSAAVTKLITSSKQFPLLLKYFFKHNRLKKVCCICCTIFQELLVEESRLGYIET